MIQNNSYIIDTESGKIQLTNPTNDDLVWVKFDGKTFDNIAFDEIKCSHFVFDNCVFESCTFGNKWNFHERIHFNKCSFKDCTLDNVSFDESVFISCDFTYQNLRNLRITNSRLHDCDFRHTDLNNVRFTACELTECNFLFANFIGCSMLASTLQGCNAMHSNIVEATDILVLHLNGTKGTLLAYGTEIQYSFMSRPIAWWSETNIRDLFGKYKYSEKIILEYLGYVTLIQNLFNVK